MRGRGYLAGSRRLPRRGLNAPAVVFVSALITQFATAQVREIVETDPVRSGSRDTSPETGLRTALESPPGCEDAAVSVGIMPVPGTSVSHGTQICYTVCYGAQGAANPCDITNFNADLVLPDGTVRAVATDASIDAATFFCCPSGDPRCNAALSPADYCYTVDHADEATSFVGCPPVPSGSSGRVIAYTSGEGVAQTIKTDAVAPCATANNIVNHGACCDPCTGVCDDTVSGHECLPPNTFSPGLTCALANCQPKNCDDDNECTADSCEADVCFNVPDCLEALDCPSDNDPCTADICTELGCCDYVPLCVDNLDCQDDGNVCTTETCGPDGCCISTPECILDTDCADDGNACTAETCSPLGCCVRTPDCVIKDDCPDDGNACTAEVCTQDSCCISIPGCDMPEDCDDMNACTADMCNASGCCENTPECTVNSDCDDLDACTTDTCTPQGCCSNVAFCVGNQDCLDVNPCTDDTCVAGCCQSVCRTPGIQCPADQTFECDNVGAFGDPIVTDDCSLNPIVECTEVSAPGGLPQEEIITRTCKVTNDCGNMAECSHTINIVDTTPPEITCPPDLQFECDGIGDFGQPEVTDNCDPDPEVTIEVEEVINDCTQREAMVAGISIPPKLTITRTATASDGLTLARGENTAVCMQRIDIYDTTPPVIVNCPLPFQACEGDPLDFVPPTCEDACGVCQVYCERSDGLALTDPVGALPLLITCTATDECDIVSAPCEFEVTEAAECQTKIPTVSEWGLVILALLLAIGGKIFSARDGRRGLA